jgi:signal transduction histidine kinase
LDDLDRCLRSTVAFADSDPGLAACLAEVQNTREDLEQIARGLHPRLLAEQGLAAALHDLSRRSPVPLQVRAPAGRFPATTEQALWYACAEAVANLWKHSAATSARVSVTDLGGAIRATIEDDGVGGATVAGTGGLPGLVDRLGAVDGQLRLNSTPAGTTLDVTVPLP